MRSVTFSPDQVGSEVHIPSLPFYVISITLADEICVDLAGCFGALIFLATGEQHDWVPEGLNSGMDAWQQRSYVIYCVYEILNISKMVAEFAFPFITQ